MVVGHNIAVGCDDKAGAGDAAPEGLAGDCGGSVTGDAHHGAHVLRVDLGGGQHLSGGQRGGGVSAGISEGSEPGLQSGDPVIKVGGLLRRLLSRGRGSDEACEQTAGGHQCHSAPEGRQLSPGLSGLGLLVGAVKAFVGGILIGRARGPGRFGSGILRDGLLWSGFLGDGLLGNGFFGGGPCLLDRGLFQRGGFLRQRRKCIVKGIHS